MFLRRLSLSKTCSRIRWNKIRLTNKHGVTEIESWIGFDSRNKRNDEK